MAIGRPISLTPNIATKNISSLATADQTEFTVTGGYRINEIAVYRNGVRLAQGRDFTASDGSTVNLVTAASVSDVIEFSVFDSFNVADAIVSAASSQNLNGDFNVTGNLYAGTFKPGELIVGVVTANTALYVGSALTANAAGDVETIGIITAGSFSGDGSALTGVANTDYVISIATTTGNLNVSAAATITGEGTFSSDVSIGGTLSYQDVTNVDAVGLITARSGVNITGGEFKVGTAVTIGSAGIITSMGGTLDLKNSGSVSNIKFYCESGNSHYTAVQSAAHSAYGGNVTLTLPTTTDTLVARTTTDTLTNKTLTSPTITGTGSLTGGAGDFSSNLTVGSGITMGSAGVATFSGTADVHLTDSVRLLLGTGLDLRITHDGSHGYIQENTGNLRIDADTLQLRSSAGENYLYGAADGAVTLYHDSSAKLATSATGVTITGNATATKFLGDGSALTGVGGDMDITSCLFV